jgi:para-nitrobenzyl esterase
MVTLASTVMAWTATDAAQSDDRIVKIDAGMTAGAVSGKVLSFKGIPYAAPPVRDLRWRAPQPVTPWRSSFLCCSIKLISGRSAGPKPTWSRH